MQPRAEVRHGFPPLCCLAIAKQRARRGRHRGLGLARHGLPDRSRLGDATPDSLTCQVLRARQRSTFAAPAPFPRVRSGTERAATSVQSPWPERCPAAPSNRADRAGASFDPLGSTRPGVGRRFIRAHHGARGLRIPYRAITAEVSERSWAFAASCWQRAMTEGECHARGDGADFSFTLLRACRRRRFTVRRPWHRAVKPVSTFVSTGRRDPVTQGGRE